MNFFSKNSLVGILLILLGLAVWAGFRLFGFHENNVQTTVYTESLPLISGVENFQCSQRTSTKLDINDYSYNVLEKTPSTKIYKYISNLNAEPPINVHVVAMQQGGSARVTVEKTDKPTWLVLASNHPSIWHIEHAPGAKLEKVIVHHKVNEVSFTNTLPDNRVRIVDFLLGKDSMSLLTPEIVVLPETSCLGHISPFQEFNHRKRFTQAIFNLRKLIGYPEVSYQVINEPSYFLTPFKVPFERTPRSVTKLARITQLAEAPRRPISKPKLSLKTKSELLAESLKQYENMPRKKDTKAVTFSNVKDFLKVLSEYRSRKLLPSLFPLSNMANPSRQSGVIAWYDFSKYQNSYTKQALSGVTKNACGRDHNFLVIEGTNDTNIVKCARGEQLYFMKDGGDHIDDSWGDDIIYAGPGNDIIDAHWGNDLIFFNYGWGQDTIDKTCSLSAYVPQNSIGAKKVYWNKQWPYKNFIVFGQDVRKEDIVSVKGKLVHKLTGDSITIKGDCFNIVYWK